MQPSEPVTDKHPYLAMPRPFTEQTGSNTESVGGHQPDSRTLTEPQRDTSNSDTFPRYKEETV